MKKDEKIYELNSILSEQAFRRLQNYLTKVDKFGSENNDYGRDGLAMIGSGAKPGQVCQMFNVLADPEFINLRSDWGDITGQENEVIPDIDNYTSTLKNSFAIKKNAVRFSGHMNFPLVNNFMTVDGQVKHIDFNVDWEAQKQLFQESLGMTILDNQEFDALFEYQEKTNPQYVRLEDNVPRSAAAKIVYASLSVFKKMFKAVKLEDKFPFNKQLEKYGPEHKEKVCFVSNKFKNQEMSNLDKFVAVVDALTYEKMKQVAKTKEVRNDLKVFSEDEQRKILLASKLVANWAVCMASDLGVENHKQMDNALKLELNSLLGTLPQNNRNITTAISNISQDLTTEMFSDLKHLDYASIVEHRKDLGLEYVDRFNLGHFATWEEMKTYSPNAINLHQVLFGRTINKAFSLDKNNIQFKGYSPAFSELQPDAKLVNTPVAPTPTLTPPQNITSLEPQQDEIAGNVLGVIVPKGVTFDNIVEVDDKNKFIVYKDINGNEVKCDYLANDGKDLREFVNGGDGLGQVLTLSDDEVDIFAKDKYGKESYYGNLVKLEDLSMYKKLVQDSKNEATTYTGVKETVEEDIVPTPGERLEENLVERDTEKGIVLPNSPKKQPTKGEKFAQTLEENKKRREQLKLERAKQKRNAQVAKNEEQRKFDDTFIAKVKYLDKKPTTSPESNIEDKNLKQTKYLDKKPTFPTESNILDVNLKKSKYNEKKPTAMQSPDYSDEALWEASSQQQAKEYDIEKRNAQVAKNEEQRKFDDANMSIVASLDRKSTPESAITDVNMKKAGYVLNNKAAASPESNIEDKNLKKSKYNEKKPTAMGAPDYSDEALLEASSQQQAKEYDIAKRNAQVAKNKEQRKFDETNMDVVENLDKLQNKINVQNNLANAKNKFNHDAEAEEYEWKLLNGKKGKRIVNRAHGYDEKPNEPKKVVSAVTEPVESEDKFEDVSVARYLDVQEKVLKGQDISRYDDLIEEFEMKADYGKNTVHSATGGYVEKVTKLSAKNKKTAKNSVKNEVVQNNEQLEPSKKKNVCPHYDSERLYQLMANGVLPELDAKQKKLTSKNENGIILAREIESKTKSTKKSKTTLQEQNPELFKKKSSTKRQTRRNLKEINPELF